MTGTVALWSAVGRLVLRYGLYGDHVNESISFQGGVGLVVVASWTSIQSKVACGW